MSALLVDDMVVPVPTRPQPGRWRHVERGPQARPRLVGLPGGRPEGVPAPELRPARPGASRPAAASAESWQLTDRGIAVVVIFFLAVVAAAAVVLVGGFLSVSDAPLPSVPAAAVVPATHG
nr:hypothetical protein [Propionicimonas sp.]